MLERVKEGAIGLPLRKAGDHPFGMLQGQRLEKARVLAIAEAYRQPGTAQRAHRFRQRTRRWRAHDLRRQALGAQALRQRPHVQHRLLQVGRLGEAGEAARRTFLAQ